MFNFKGAEHCYVTKTINVIEKPVITQDFKLSNKFCEDLKGRKAPFSSDIAQTTFFRTYSRLRQDGQNERWADTIIRVINGTISAYLTHMSKLHLSPREDINEYAESMALSCFNLEWTPPGRGLYAMGTDYIKERGNAALNNCYAVSTKNNLIKAAAWGMDMLMCGGGVGFDVTWEGGAVRPDKNDSFTFVIPDSRQGWVAALELLLRAYIPINGVITNKFPRFDYSQVRPYGAKIHGFGGTASGPEPLRVLLERVEVFSDTYVDFKDLNKEDPLYPKLLCNLYEKMISDMIDKDAYETTYKTDKQIIFDNVRKSIEKHIDLKDYNETRYVTDVFNVIASCVVAGNVRRSSEIAIGDAGTNDIMIRNCNTFINLKNYEVNPERGPWAWNSNNTVRFHTNEDFEKWIKPISELVKVNGEPGIYNLINVGKYGRFSDLTRPYDDATLINPCGEIVLCSYEPCTLSVVCPYNCRKTKDEQSELDLEKISRATEYATFYATVVTTIPHHWPDSNAIIAKNRRIGVSFAGVTNIYEIYGHSTLTTISRNNYHHVVKCNEKFAQEMGIPPSIRVTTIKPEGTISLITGLNPGIHFPIVKYGIRRINVGNGSPLINVLKEAGFNMEPSEYSPNTTVIEFPIYTGPGRCVDDVSMFEQFGLLQSMQRHWSDNSCSDTINFNKSLEGRDVERAISMFIPSLKTFSMLGKESDGSVKGYKQLPNEKISEKQYTEILNNIKPVNWEKLYSNGAHDGIQPRFCTNDSCSL